MNRNDAEILLKARFGFDHFYDEQWETIDRLLNGKRVLMVQKTGFGKSLCYQFPSAIFPGMTIVFSPLIALMRDQLQSLEQKGISAACVNSEQAPEENNAILQRAINGEIKILYIAPERLDNSSWQEAVMQMNISLIVIDEAHTISTWGHDFRPSFRRIVDLVKTMPKSMPILATTATATFRVQEDIASQIGESPLILRGSLVRSNFSLRVIVVKSEEEKLIWLANNLGSFNGTGIIYCGTRINTELYSAWLQYKGISATCYNAGLEPDCRMELEDGLMHNRWKCVVSTNALGMGIDKPDIRFVIHTQVPVSPVHYYQEIGRAGRDGKPAEIILFYNNNQELGMDADRALPTSFIENARPSISKYNSVIDILQRGAFTASEIIRNCNLKTNQFAVIKEDLIDQGIIAKTDKKRFEYVYGAPKLNTDNWDVLKALKIKELQSMIDYVYTTEPRMKFLCSFLDCNEDVNFQNCDNTNLPKISVQYSKDDLKSIDDFSREFYPELRFSKYVFRFITENEVKKRIAVRRSIPNTWEIAIGKNPPVRYLGNIDYGDFSDLETEKIKDIVSNYKSRVVDGFASSYYGLSDIGQHIHHCKYEGGGDFPDSLVDRMYLILESRHLLGTFDLVTFVPPTKSGDLVENYARRLALKLGIPCVNCISKVRETREQKIFQNNYGKAENIAGAFCVDETLCRDKKVLLVDDVYDSGVTLKEIAKELSEKNVDYVMPVAIAKTVGGTL